MCSKKAVAAHANAHPLCMTAGEPLADIGGGGITLPPIVIRCDSSLYYIHTLRPRSHCLREAGRCVSSNQHFGGKTHLGFSQCQQERREACAVQLFKNELGTILTH